MMRPTSAEGADDRQDAELAAAGEDSRTVIGTERLILRRFDLDDAAFIFELVNDPDWLRHIGDKGVRSLDDARNYLRTGPLDMYARHGFGLFAVALRKDGTLIGSCGLIKRDSLQGRRHRLCLPARVPLARLRARGRSGDARLRQGRAQACARRRDRLAGEPRVGAAARTHRPALRIPAASGG